MSWVQIPPVGDWFTLENYEYCECESDDNRDGHDGPDDPDVYWHNGNA